MAKARTLVGLDVHATKIVAAVLDAETGELQTFAMSGECGPRPGSARGCRGRCGSRMRPARPGTGSRASSRSVAWSASSRRRARSRARRGIGSRPIGVTPSMLVRLLLAGKLHPVRVPGAEEEALRDLVRAREAVRVDLMRCRHRLSKLLLRHGIRFDDGPAWTERHRDVAGDGRAGVAGGAGDAARRAGRDRRAGSPPRPAGARDRRAAPGSPWAVQVGRLRCLRGIDTLTAVGLCAEIGDFERFARAEQLMSYIGLVPCESHDRAAAPARVDHQDRVRARPAAAGRGRLALPPAPPDRQGADRPPGRPAARSDRDRLVSPTTPAPHLGPARGARQTPHDHRRRRRPRTRRVLLGDHPNRVTPDRRQPDPVGWVGGGPARAGNPRRSYEQPAPTGAGHARS